VSARGKRYGRPETLEVTGHFLKGKSAITLQIVSGSSVMEVHELLWPEGSVLASASGSWNSRACHRNTESQNGRAWKRPLWVI